MYQKAIYDEAIRRIQERRISAQKQQETRTDQIRAKIPEIAELDRQLRNTCLSLAKTFGTNDCKERIKKLEQYCESAENMLRRILVQHGYPENYLDTQYLCPHCNDTGFVGGKPCECLIREIGMLGAEKLNEQSQLSLSSFNSFSLSFYNNLPPEEYREMCNIFEKCRSYAQNFNLHTSDNILMIGNTGLGKTHLSLSIATVLLQNGYSVIYDSVGNLMHKLEMEHFGKNSDGNTLDLLLECDLLILDDFGTEFVTSFTKSMIYTIINSRINAEKPFIVNTNLVEEDLQEQYGNRILSRLFSASIMQFYGRDIRQQKRIQQNRSQEART